jgi:hypothetical protein
MRITPSQRASGNSNRMGTSDHNARFGAPAAIRGRDTLSVPSGGSARGYQAIFVASATLGSPGYDGQPAAYLYIAALEVNVLD